MEEMRCLVCQGQSIADSDAELAGDMRDLVRRRIAAGEKPDQVRAWLIARYGSWISYRPTAEPAAWPLWLAPIALLLIGAFLIRRRIGDEALMGWLILLLLVALSLAALWLMGVRGAMLRPPARRCCSGSAGYALQGRPELRGAPAAADPEPRLCFAGRGAARLLRQFHGRGELAADVGGARRVRATARTPSESSRMPSRRYPRRRAIVDRPRQCAGRSCARPDSAGRARLPPRGRASLRAIPPRHSSTGWRWPVLATARRAVALWRSMLAKAPAGASWRPLVEQGVAALGEQPARAAALRRRPARIRGRAPRRPPGGGSCRRRR